MGNTFVKFLIVAYFIIAIAFVLQKPPDWGRVLYFIGAITLSCGILMMK